MRAHQVLQHTGLDNVALVPRQQHGHVVGADLAQHRVDRSDAPLCVGSARVDDVQQEIGVDHLFQCRAEGVNELVRQPADESHRVRQQHRLAAGEPEPASRGIERREQLVLDEHTGVGEPVEERGLAGVGVADERDRGQVAAASSLALRVARRAELAQVAFETLDPAEQPPPIDLELRLTRAAGADATTLLAELGTATAQAREAVTKLRELDLHRTVLAGRVLGEDVEDQRDAVDDVDVEQASRAFVAARA